MFLGVCVQTALATMSAAHFSMDAYPDPGVGIQSRPQCLLRPPSWQEMLHLHKCHFRCHGARCNLDSRYPQSTTRAEVVVLKREDFI